MAASPRCSTPDRHQSPFPALADRRAAAAADLLELVPDLKLDEPPWPFGVVQHIDRDWVFPQALKRIWANDRSGALAATAR